MFDELERQAVAEAAEEGFARASLTLTRRLDLRYPHQGYSLGVDCPLGPLSDSDKPAIKRLFDELHHQMYGQSAPDEAAELVTFRVQTEISVPQLCLPGLKIGTGDPSGARSGERRLYDVDRSQFVTAQAYDRSRLRAGDQIVGPAVIDQLDSTTVILADQQATIDRYGTCIITPREP